MSVSRLRVGPREPGDTAAWASSPFTCGFIGISLEVIYGRGGVDAVSGIAASGSELVTTSPMWLGASCCEV